MYCYGINVNVLTLDGVIYFFVDNDTFESARNPHLEICHSLKKACLKLAIGRYVEIPYTRIDKYIKSNKKNVLLCVEGETTPSITVPVFEVVKFSIPILCSKNFYVDQKKFEDELRKEEDDDDKDEAELKELLGPSYDNISDNSIDLSDGEDIDNPKALNNAPRCRKLEYKKTKDGKDIVFVAMRGGGMGESWESPCNLEQGLELARRFGNTELWLQKGVYKLGEPLILHGNITIRGGFIGRENSERDRPKEKLPDDKSVITILGCLFAIGCYRRCVEAEIVLDSLHFSGIDSYCIYAENVYLVLYACQFTKNAGGIKLRGTDCELSECTFRLNSEEQNSRSGNVITASESNLLIKNTRFENNTMVSLPMITSENSVLDIRNTIIMNNVCHGKSPTIMIKANSHVLGVHCTIANNISKGFAAGIVLENSYTDFANSIIYGNKLFCGESSDLQLDPGTPYNVIRLNGCICSPQGIKALDEKTKKDIPVFNSEYLNVLTDIPMKTLSGTELKKFENRQIVWLRNTIYDDPQLGNVKSGNKLIDENSEIRTESIPQSSPAYRRGRRQKFLPKGMIIPPKDLMGKVRQNETPSIGAVEFSRLPFVDDFDRHPYFSRENKESFCVRMKQIRKFEF